MTLVVASAGLLIADALRLIEGEARIRPGKVHAYPKPERISSKTMKISDVFFGFAGSGDDQVIEFAGYIAIPFGFDEWLRRYTAVDYMRCLTEHVGFYLMFIGLKGVMAASVVNGDICMKYYPYSEFSTVATGSGAGAYAQVINGFSGKICPVKAMSAASLIEPSCGGGFEVWSIPTSSKGKLTRLVDIEKLRLPGLFQMVSKPNVKLYPEEHAKWLTKHTPNSARLSRKQSTEKEEVEKTFKTQPGFQALSWNSPYRESFFRQSKT